MSLRRKLLLLLAVIVGLPLLVFYGARVNAYLEGMAPGQIPDWASQRTTVTIWSGWVGDEQDYFEHAIDVFNESQNEIYVRDISTVEDDTKIFRAISAGVPPDLAILWDVSYIGTLAATSAVQPLDSFFEGSALRREAFLPQALASGTYKGRLYALPYLVDVSCIFWTELAFRDAGLDVDKGPETLSQLEEYIKALVKFDERGKLLRLAFEPPDPDVCLAIWGARFYDPERHRIACDEPRAVEALKWRMRITDLQGGADKVAGFQAGFGNFDSPQHQFFHGLVAIEPYGEWWPGYVQRYGPHVRYRIGPLPHPDQYPETKDLAYGGGNYVCMPTGAKHPREAWRFMEWMHSEQGQVVFAEKMQGCPDVKAVAERMVPTPEQVRLAKEIVVDRSLPFEEQKRRADPIRRARYGTACGIALSPNWAVFPPLPVNILYKRELLAAFQYAERGSKTPEQALADCQRRVQAALEGYLRG